MIAIIGAMDEEVELLKSKMTISKEEKVANSNFYVGTLEGKEVVLLQSGIGKVNAAMSTTIMFEKYQPDYVINTGSSGGYHSDLEVGDIVISDYVVHHDVDVTAFKYEYGQVPGMPPKFEADELLITRTMEAAAKVEGVQVMKGLISTGDTFMEDPERVQFVRETFPDVIAAEMEAAAIAQVCYQYNKPFVVIRALSDIAGKKSSVSFDAFLKKAAENASILIMDVIKKL